MIEWSRSFVKVTFRSASIWNSPTGSASDSRLMSCLRARSSSSIVTSSTVTRTIELTTLGSSGSSRWLVFVASPHCHVPSPAR
jgi:hypothetical protein